MAETTPRTDAEAVGPAGPRRRIWVEPTGRRVRAFAGGTGVVDSRRALLLLELGHLPVYYFPPADVRQELLTPTEHRTHCPYKGDAAYWNLRLPGRTVENAAWSYPQPLPERADIAGYLAFYWDALDAWFEEDDQIFAHPRSPYHRVDVLNSSRHVRVVLGGVTVAETDRPRLLFETGLPTRYYIPKLDVRLDLLEPSPSRSRCPYKGEAVYWSVRAGEQHFPDIAWSYPLPIPECPKIENLICFYNERVDAIEVDGEPLPPTRTKWSLPE